ncbi:MAG TPA: hypothetical protein VEI97_02470, partial [bacterium]|nr:hypothetical protein [bacterium]
DENPYVRLRAAKALANWIARLGTEVDLAQTKALLEQLKADEDTHVRLMARQAEGIGLMNDPLGYRVTISSPLLTGRSPDPLEDQEEWDAFVDVALGEFDWSLGYNLPVPSEASRMVFELLWEDYPDLQPKVLEAVARGPRAGESGFLQTAWASGEPGLQARGLELMTELLLEEGELGEEFDETIREVAGSELAELEPPVRTAAVRFLLTLARSRTIARFKPEEVTTWKEAVTSLYYSPRDTVRQLVTTLNPTHPWLAEAAKGRFADDAQLRPTIPRLHRMVWYREDPQAIDPKTGEMDPETVHPLTAEDLDQLWRWEILPPLHTLESVLPAEGVSPSIAGIRAAALVLRGEMKSTAEEA